MSKPACLFVRRLRYAAVALVALAAVNVTAVVQPSKDADRSAEKRKAQTKNGIVAKANADDDSPIVAKASVPSAEKQQVIEKQIREQFAAEFAPAKKGANKKGESAAALATALLRRADASRDDFDRMYVLLSLARKAAVDAGEAELALDALNRLAFKFEIDAPAERFATLTKLATTANQPAAMRSVYNSASQAAIAYLKDDQYADAVKMLRVAANLARKAKENELVRQTAVRINEVAALERENNTAKAAIEKLATEPDDPDANLAAGRWHWFRKAHFAQGVKHLAKGSDEELKAAAAGDVAAPAGAKEQVDLANLWMTAAEKRKGAEKMMLEARAFYWYLKSSSVAAGMEKAQIDKRVDEMRGNIEKRLLADAFKTSPADAGNVADFLMPGVVVEYFADPQLQTKLATKTALTLRAEFAHERELGLPPGTRLTARWIGWIALAKSGSYKIRINTRGAFWLDGKPLIGPRTNPPETVVELSPRPHHFRYEMPEVKFGTAATLQFYPADEAPRPLPPDAMFHVPLAGEPPVELRWTQINPAIKSSDE